MAGQGINLEKEDEDRARFEQYIGDGERRLTEQMLRIERLRATGQDTKEAERFLASLRQNLEEWHRTRDDVATIKQTYQLLEETAPPASPARDGVQD